VQTMNRTGAAELSIHLLSASVLDEMNVQFHTLVD